MSDRREVGLLLLVRNLKRDGSTKGHGLDSVIPSVSDAEHVRHGLEQGPRVLFQPIGFLEEIRKRCRSFEDQSSPTYLKFIDCNPGVGREALQHWHEELQASAPVADEEHHTDQVEDPHEHGGHVEELQ